MGEAELILWPLLFPVMLDVMQVQPPNPLSMVLILLLVLQLISADGEEVGVARRETELSTACIEL